YGVLVVRLPGVAGADVRAGRRAGATGGGDHRAGHGAGAGARDDEVAAGLRVARHGVARARGDVELDATGGRAERQAGVGERAARVGLVVGEAGLDRRDGGTSVGLGGGVL